MVAWKYEIQEKVDVTIYSKTKKTGRHEESREASKYGAPDVVEFSSGDSFGGFC